jgi:hypothetical protein
MAKINVVVVDATGSKEQEAAVPDDVEIGKIIDKLIEIMHLPAVNPSGIPITYRFLHKPTGRQLRDDLTLAQSEVNEGDLLRLLPEITAGGL